MDTRNPSVTIALEPGLRVRLERIKAAGVTLTAVVGDGLERRVATWEERLGLAEHAPRRSEPVDGQR